MSSYIPQLQSSEPDPSAEPRVLNLHGSEGDDVFETLSSKTRRDILKQLYEAPATPSELAGATETTIQNVHYHLEKLSAVDLVEQVGTQYSEKGNEMRVYAPANDPIVIVESEETKSRVESRLERIVGVLSLLAIASLLVQWLASMFEPPRAGYAFNATEAADVSISTTAAERGPDLVAQAQQAALEPGTLVFLGGLVALLVYLGIRRIST